MGASTNAADLLLEATLEGAGDRIALLWRDARLSYRDVMAGVNRTGNALRALGVGPDDRVILMLKDSPAMVFALIGAMKIGAVAVPLGVRLTSGDLLHAVNDSGAKALLIDGEFLPLYRDIEGRIDAPATVVAVDAANGAHRDFAALVGDRSDALETVPRAPEDMAFWLYTSGTTGQPKGAVHRHADVAFADAYLSEVLGVAPGDVLFATSKLFFAYALGTCLFGAFRLGATTVLFDGWPDPAAVADILARTRPAVVFSVPALYRNMLEAGVAADPAFARVRHYVSAGERLPEGLWRRWKEACGVEIIDGMGATETTYMILTNRPGNVRPGSSGTAAPHAEVRLTDFDGNPVALGAPGVLWARMGSCCAGYWGREAVWREVFRDGWFRTGDVYAVDGDGFWHHQGRDDDMLRISGQWVSPAEIEETVLAHTPLREALVVGVPDRDELTRVVLFAVGPEEDFDEEALRAEIRRAATRHLSPYKCPKWVRFVDEIPRTATGKAQRYRLRERFAEEVH